MAARGGDVMMQMLLARELARSLGGLAWIWGITSFAGSKSIGLYGTEAQKTKFLPLIATGQLKAAIAFTEPSAAPTCSAPCAPMPSAPMAAGS